MLFITDVFPSSVPPWNPTDPNQDRSTDWPIIHSLLWCCHLQTPTWQSVNLYVSVVCVSFSSEFGLHHHSHHPTDTAVTDSDWSLLLQAACQRVRIQNKGKNAKDKQEFYFTWRFPTIPFWNISYSDLWSTVTQTSAWSSLSRLIQIFSKSCKPKAVYLLHLFLLISLLESLNPLHHFIGLSTSSSHQEATSCHLI